jgi:hypothetical protein
VTCDQVEALAVDVARGTLDPGSRESVLDHAGRCPRCASLLEAERRLSSALSALARATEGESAPPAVEVALRTAFAGELARAASATDPISAGRPGRVFPGGRSARGNWPWWAAAAASLLAVSFLVSPQGPGGSPARKGPPASPVPPEAEAGDFVLLGYGESFTEMDSVHVVRVELPGSALAGLGWPPQAGPDSAAVTADVVVGPDGIARAIRVVGGGSERDDEGGEGS